MAAPDRRLLVAICHNSPMVFQKTAQSLMELGWGNRVEQAKQAHGFSAIDFFWSTRWPRVDCLRDDAVTLAKAEGHSHILFLDCDMVWPTDVLDRLLAHHDVGIVGALYTLKEHPYSPVAMTDQHRDEGSKVDKFLFVQEYGTDLIDVDVLGMGCTLVPMAVFEAIGPRPWFEYKDDDDGWPRVTEDVPFCLKAKEAGFRIVLDPTIKCGHVTTNVIDDRFFKRYMKGEAETARRLKVSAVPEPVGARGR